MKLVSKTARILSTALILSSFSHTAFSAHFSGPFLGIHAGGAVALDKYNSRLDELRVVPPQFVTFARIPVFENQFQLSGVTATGGFDGGYDVRFGNRNDIVVGAELFYDFQHRTITKTLTKTTQDPFVLPQVITYSSEVINYPYE